MKTILIILFTSFLFFTSNAFGGGTVGDHDVNEVLNQQPELADFIRSEFEYCRAAWLADTRLASHFPLGGARLGPYERRARKQGSKGGFDFVLKINTLVVGYDANGNGAEITQATKIVEKILSVDVRFDPCVENWCKSTD